jgi:hypothetical protein
MPAPRGQRRRPPPSLPSRDLRTHERVRLAVEILVTYLVVRLVLRRAPIAVAVARLRSGPGASQRLGTLTESRRLGRAVGRTLRWAPGDTRCLVRSLVLTRMLARRGIEARLVIAARARPEFLAHAWVEHDGEPILDPGDSSFGRLVEI